MKRTRTMMVVLAGAGLLMGCAQDVVVAEDPNALTGFISEDRPLDDGSSVGVFWLTPRFEGGYLFGQGETTDGRFRVELDGEPPEDARNIPPGEQGHFGDAWAFGLLVAYPPGTVMEPGAKGEGDLGPYTGFGTHHALIWRGLFGPDDGWMSAFGAGYSCGVCLPSGTGYEPAPCDEVALVGITKGESDDDDYCSFGLNGYLEE